MNTIIILSLLLKAAVSIDKIPDADDKLHIYALPVGQGDCTVIQCPKATGGPKKGIVTIIDAGSSTKKEASMRKDVIVYHPCSWQSYNIIGNKFGHPKQVHSCYSIANCKNQVPELNLCPHDDSIKLSFVASAIGGCKDNKAHNKDSLIAKITYAGISTLITGDFEASPNAIKEFLSTARSDLYSDIYKLSHHGAYNGIANQEQFLDAIKAKYVFSSSGFKYKHPRCEIFEYYKTALPNDHRITEHFYTCFNKNNKFMTENTKKAIYVTHLYRPVGFQKWVKSYYLIKFSISRIGNFKFGHVDVDFTWISDEHN
uniref:Metallo-beta-lactamase domain-containing protein n=1 Tax=Amphimedon queenslandica TaxID=400682 RepID=A0A1X7UZP6_AMPQE